MLYYSILSPRASSPLTSLFPFSGDKVASCGDILQANRREILWWETPYKTVWRLGPSLQNNFLISPGFHVGSCTWHEHCKEILKGTILNSISTLALGIFFIQEQCRRESSQIYSLLCGWSFPWFTSFFPPISVKIKNNCFTLFPVLKLPLLFFFPFLSKYIVLIYSGINNSHLSPPIILCLHQRQNSGFDIVWSFRCSCNFATRQLYPTHLK